MRLATRAALLACALVLGAAACSSSPHPNPETAGATARATGLLRGYGLTAQQATCMVDKLGAAVVDEASDLNALSQGGPYQAAAKSCIHGG